MNELTQAELSRLLDYDPSTGVFTSRGSRRGVRAGTVAGCQRPDGYICIRVCGPLYLAHRLAWLYMTGEWPSTNLDHVNGEKCDNRWSNLREAPQADNVCNAKRRADNTSGVKGVQRNHSGWMARVKRRGVSVCKTFRAIEDAEQFVRELREQLHGEFARHY